MRRSSQTTNDRYFHIIFALYTQPFTSVSRTKCILLIAFCREQVLWIAGGIAAVARRLVCGAENGFLHWKFLRRRRRPLRVRRSCTFPAMWTGVRNGRCSCWSATSTRPETCRWRSFIVMVLSRRIPQSSWPVFAHTRGSLSLRSRLSRSEFGRRFPSSAASLMVTDLPRSSIPRRTGWRCRWD